MLLIRNHCCRFWPPHPKQVKCRLSPYLTPISGYNLAGNNPLFSFSQPWLHIKISQIALKDPSFPLIHYIKVLVGGFQALLFFQVAHMVLMYSQCLESLPSISLLNMKWDENSWEFWKSKQQRVIGSGKRSLELWRLDNIVASWRSGSGPWHEMAWFCSEIPKIKGKVEWGTPN